MKARHWKVAAVAVIVLTIALGAVALAEDKATSVAVDARSGATSSNDGYLLPRDDDTTQPKVPSRPSAPSGRGGRQSSGGYLLPRDDESASTNDQHLLPRDGESSSRTIEWSFSLPDGDFSSKDGGRGILPSIGGAILDRWGDRQGLTDEQREALDAATAEAADAFRTFLDKLADAGILSRAELEAYDRAAEQQDIAATIDVSQWTVEKARELTNALRKSGSERQEALDALVSEGLLTQAQADALLATRVTSSSIDTDNWTVAQARQFREALTKTGDERAQALASFVADGLLTQSQADALLASNLRSLGSRMSSSLTDEQKAAWKDAWEAYTDSWQAIRDAWQDKTQE